MAMVMHALQMSKVRDARQFPKAAQLVRGGWGFNSELLSESVLPKPQPCTAWDLVGVQG